MKWFDLLVLTIFFKLVAAFAPKFCKDFRHGLFRRRTKIELFAGKGFAAVTNKKDKKQSAAADSFYPPMTREEIQKWMDHIPVYAVTDLDGNGQALRLGREDNKKAVLYFFMSPIMAEAFLKHLQKSSTGDGNLTVSGLFLGRIWFDILNKPDQENNDDSSDVEYRLVPDPRDLISARTLLTLDPDESKVETIEDSAFVEKVMNSTSQFSKLYNGVPLFCVDNMPLANQKEDVKRFLNQMVSSSYMYFSSQNMFDVLDETKQQNGESEDDLTSLQKVVEQMQTESTVDFRNVVLVPPAPVTGGPIPDSLLDQQLKDSESFIAKNFFLPLFYE